MESCCFVAACERPEFCHQQGQVEAVSICLYLFQNEPSGHPRRGQYGIVASGVEESFGRLVFQQVSAQARRDGGIQVRMYDRIRFVDNFQNWEHRRFDSFQRMGQGNVL